MLCFFSHIIQNRNSQKHKMFPKFHRLLVSLVTNNNKNNQTWKSKKSTPASIHHTHTYTETVVSQKNYPSEEKKEKKSEQIKDRNENLIKHEQKMFYICIYLHLVIQSCAVVILLFFFNSLVRRKKYCT